MLEIQLNEKLLINSQKRDNEVTPWGKQTENKQNFFVFNHQKIKNFWKIENIFAGLQKMFAYFSLVCLKGLLRYRVSVLHFHDKIENCLCHRKI